MRGIDIGVDCVIVAVQQVLGFGNSGACCRGRCGNGGCRVRLREISWRKLERRESVKKSNTNKERQLVMKSVNKYGLLGTAAVLVVSAVPASAQYVFTNAPDPSAVINNAQSAWTSVSGLKISIIAFVIVAAIVLKIVGRR